MQGNESVRKADYSKCISVQHVDKTLSFFKYKERGEVRNGERVVRNRVGFRKGKRQVRNRERE